jgi:hypothetical protein
MELHVAVCEARRRHGAALWAEVMPTGNWTVMAECHDIDALLRTAERKAKRIAGLLSEARCADGIASAGHGAAA